MTQQEHRELSKKKWHEVFCIDGYVMTKKQQKAMYDEVYKPIDDMHKEIKKYNKSIWKQVKELKGLSFYKNAKRWFADLSDQCYRTEEMKLEIIEKPIGKIQCVDGCYGRKIRHEYVSQYAEGLEGDSFSGTCCIELSDNKYLKTNFSM